MHLLGFLSFEGTGEARAWLTVLAAGMCALPSRWLWGVLGSIGPWSAIVVVGVVSFVAVAGLAIKRGIPRPYVHDEFSYLLAGDTFAHGRLTNPQHPMWEHFESMHILARPTYMSKYPPGQGLALALGQAVTGEPIWGVWVATVLASAAMCWMLMAFVPVRWALVGGLMAALHPQMLEWGQRYWGATLAALGGALAIGGWGRMISIRGGRQSSVWSWREAMWMGVGMVVLANTRPYEGAVLAGVLVLGLVWRMVSEKGRIAGAWGMWGAMAGVLAVGAGLMAYYNWRVTGSAFRLPYQEHQSQYGAVPLFIFQARGAQPAYRHKEIETFQVREQVYWYKRHDSWYELRKEAIKNLGRLRAGCLGNVEVLALPLVLLPWMVWKVRRVRWLVGVLAVVTGALLLETYCFPHYATPAAGVVAVIAVMALRRMSRLGWPMGRLMARVTVGVFVAWSAVWWAGFYNWKQEGFAVARHEVLEGLKKQEGKHLVIVRYGEHNVHEEWVYNEAEIDEAKVVWAREMDTEHNRKLLEYFKDRKVWLIEPDVDMRELKEWGK